MSKILSNKQNNNKKQQLVSPFFDSFLLDEHPFWPAFDFDRRVNRNVQFIPQVDVKENDKQITIHANLPGMKKEDIHIDVDEKNKTLKLSGEYKKEHEESKDNYYLSERSTGKFERQFRLNNDVDWNAVSASLKDGVLDIVIGKKEAVAPEAKKVIVN